MYRDYHIDAESFGSEIPANWEEVAAFLNTVIDERLGDNPDYFNSASHDGLSAEGREIIYDVWENYLTIPGAPEWKD